jgi:glutamyl-tRNA synthetase
MPYRLKTRIAPTPSGFLHLGNAWSFVLTWLKARSEGGSVHLRIDDLDAARFRDEYLEDIFESLRWLGLDWDTGPRDAAEFKASWSQRHRLDRYREALRTLRADGHLYACGCSREQIRRDAEAAGKSPGLYPGTCRDKNAQENEENAGGGPSASLRYRMPAGPARARDAEGAAFDLRPDRDIGDFVLLQKNGDPSYQLASVADDEEAGVNFIVRGLDLLPSTGAQLALAAALGFQGFPRARFWHHALVLGEAGEKLSKSQGAEALRLLRARFPDPAPVYRFFGEALGVSGAGSARDLLPGFQWTRAPAAPLYLRDFWRSIEDA